MSTTLNPLLVITNYFGVHVNAINTGIGAKDIAEQGIGGTVISVGQTAHSVVDFALTGSGKLSTTLPGIGLALSGFSGLFSAANIARDYVDGKSPAQSDIAGVIGGVAGLAGGAAMILVGGVIVPVSVVVGVAAGTYQIVASAKGWTVDDAAYPIQQALSDIQKSEVLQTLKSLQNDPAYKAAMTTSLGGSPGLDPAKLWTSAEKFEPVTALEKSAEDAVAAALAALKTKGVEAQEAIKVVSSALEEMLEGLSAPGGNDAIITELQALHNTSLTIDPLILDLDGDGVETTALSRSTTAGVHFNLDASGLAENTGWVGKDDGLLVRDIKLGSYTRTAGSSQKMNDVWFAVDTARTLDTDQLAVSDPIAGLLDLAHMGNLRSLQSTHKQTTSNDPQYYLAA